MGEQSIWGYIIHASPIVQLVMLLLFFVSIASWAIIFQKGMLLKSIKHSLDQFEEEFWSGRSLNQFYQELNNQPHKIVDLGKIFYAGFKEFLRLYQQPKIKPIVVVEGAQRSMNTAINRTCY